MFLILVVGFGLAGYWWKNVLPFTEFQNMGQIKFPKGTQIVDFNHSLWTIKGTFLLPKDSLSEFIEKNELKAFAGELYSALRCIRDGANEVIIDLDATAAIAKIEVAGPDHSGSKVCNLQDTSLTDSKK